MSRRRVGGGGQDVRSGMLVYAALSNWALGHVDRGVAQAREAVAFSRTLGHPMSLAFAMTHAVWVLSYARLWTEALELATEAESLGAEQSLALWLAMSKAEQGVCQMHLGRLDAGLSQLATGCEAFEQTGGRNVPPMWLVDLADGHRRAGHLMDARQSLDRAVKFVRDHGGLHHLSEMSRVQGDVELAADPHATALAEAHYEHAIAAARERQAKSWELRGTMSLARLWKSSDKRAAGRERLATCLSWFEPSTESLDVRDARALLEEL